MKDEFKVNDPWELVKDVPYVSEVMNQNTSYELYKRAYHIISTAKRVGEFAKLCLDRSVWQKEKITMLGNMMNESQDSNRDNYDNSAPLINELIQLAKDSGSLGSKISGAGWGGFCIHLV